jgi:predicted Rossmann-fold nucleotide-binding protein/precorrin-6B methylase 2
MKKISKAEKELLGYKYRVTLMCSGNDTKNETYISDAQEIARGIADRNHIIVNGASENGLMGITGREAHKHGGEVYGVGLKDYEPVIHPWFSNWEGFSSYNLRIRRLTDLGDVFLALAGGLGTLHEILDLHINQFLGNELRPIIIMSPMAEIYQSLCEKVKEEGLYWDKLPENIYYANTAKEALTILDKITSHYDEEGYINRTFYPVLGSEEIYTDIKAYNEKYEVLYAGQKWVVHPDVYPPNRFRSSIVFAKNITGELCKDKVIFDIGCGPGNLGILGALNGAQKVISVDINPAAVANTEENVKRFALKNVDVRESSVFSAIGQEKADVIFFHPPFHHEKIDNNHTKLMNCVSTDGLYILNEFFKKIRTYLKPGGVIYLGFSNKDPKSLTHLEALLNKHTYEIICHEYKNSDADYRLYKITM